jgi:hypothetical protein
MSSAYSVPVESVLCYVKCVYTNNSIYYKIPIHNTVSQFIEKMKKQTARDLFDLRSHQQMEEIVNCIEVVEAGQEIPNCSPEDAPALVSEDITMHQKYGNRLKHMAFYVRTA